MNDVFCRLCADGIAVGKSEISSECALGYDQKSVRAEDRLCLVNAVEAAPRVRKSQWHQSKVSILSMSVRT